MQTSIFSDSCDAAATPPTVNRGVETLTVSEALRGQRIDNFLIARLKGVPRSRIYRILRRGEVRVNKGRVTADYKLREGDRVRVPPLRVAAEPPVAVAGGQLRQRLAASIVYDDGGLLALNKPAGLAVHGGSGLRLGLIEALRQMYPQSPFLELVHRLDRDTSGVILVARKRAVLLHLQTEFRNGQLDKCYQALALGRWPRSQKLVEAPLRKNTLKSGERMVIVDGAGKPSQTRFQVLERFSQATLLKAEPITGRTHQIRVHSQFAGCPLAGDKKYAPDDENRQFRALGLKRLFLHSAQISCSLPSGERIVVQAPLPAELDGLLQKLRKL